MNNNKSQVRVYVSSKSTPQIQAWHIVVATMALGSIAYAGLKYWAIANDYNQVEKAYKQGNCSEAIDMSDRVTNGKPLLDFNKYVERAQKYKKECQAFLAASEQQKQGKLAATIDAYSNFIERYPSSALFAKVRGQTKVLFERYEVREIAQQQFCSQLDNFLNHQLIPRLETNKPLIYWYCGWIYEKNNNYDLALKMYERFLQEFPNHELTSAFNAAKARSIVAQAAPQAANLPPPSPTDRINSSSTELVIRNDSPEEIQITFSGPEPRFERLPPCSTCVAHTDIPPQTCPGQGPIQTYQIKPGEYQVLVQSISNGNVIPFRGQWSLNSGWKYDHCFFIVQQPR